MGHKRARTAKPAKKAKAFQETSNEIQEIPKLKNIQPTIQPKEIDEIEY